jgi:uncharacterized protein (TIGR02271 family)
MKTFEFRALVGRTLFDNDGNKIGKIEQLYEDIDTGQPEWVSVKTGWFGTRHSLVPISGIEIDGDEARARWTKEQIKDSPTLDDNGRLGTDDESRLYEHYGLGYSRQRSDTGLPSNGGTADVSGQRAGVSSEDRSDRARDDAMTRSEEELRIERERAQAGTARLRKWVDTEHVSETVPVSKERARVEREPITEGNIDDAMSGPEISEGEYEMPLYEEEVTAEKRVVPKERVRLDKDVVTEQQQVEADVRKEQIEVEGDAETRDRR